MQGEATMCLALPEQLQYSGTCVNGHLRRAVTLHKAVSMESPNGIFHALHTH